MPSFPTSTSSSGRRSCVLTDKRRRLSAVPLPPNPDTRTLTPGTCVLCVQEREALMTAYVIVDITIHDKEKYGEYIKQSPALPI